MSGAPPTPGGVPSFGAALPCFGPFADPVVARDLVQAVEDLGYADVWFGDHVVAPTYAAHLTPADWLDPLASCCVGLGATTTLGFGTDVLVAPYRHPVTTAALVASAAHLAGNRLTLGVGVGYLRGEFEAVGAPPYADRGAVTDEYLAAMRAMWETDGPISFDGRHVSLHDVVFGPRPAPGTLPLWVGGNGALARRRAATLGDGWHPLFPTPEGYARGADDIRRQRDEAGTSGRPFTFSLSCATTQVLDDPDGPWRTNTWDESLVVPADFHYAPPAPATSDGRPRFVGTPDQLGEDVAAYAEAGVDHVTLRFASGGPETPPDVLVAQMELFATTVLAELDHPSPAGPPAAGDPPDRPPLPTGG